MNASGTDPTKAALLRALEIQRAHVVGVVEGLDDDAMRRPVLPSGWSCVGLINHLAEDVERLWFLIVMSGQQPFVDRGGAWQVPDDIAPAAVIENYERCVAAANEVIAATDLEAPPGAWPDGLFGDWRLTDLRHMLIHVITETACHAGHLDAARELIDGTQWMALD